MKILGYTSVTQTNIKDDNGVNVYLPAGTLIEVVSNEKVYLIYSRDNTATIVETGTYSKEKKRSKTSQDESENTNSLK